MNQTSNAVMFSYSIILWLGHNRWYGFWTSHSIPGPPSQNHFCSSSHNWLSSDPERFLHRQACWTRPFIRKTNKKAPKTKHGQSYWTGLGIESERLKIWKLQGWLVSHFVVHIVPEVFFSRISEKPCCRHVESGLAWFPVWLWLIWSWAQETLPRVWVLLQGLNYACLIKGNFQKVPVAHSVRMILKIVFFTQLLNSQITGISFLF